MKKERLLEIISNFKKLKIAVIGDLMIDNYIIGMVDRISPEAPVPVVSVKEERSVLGGAGNVINNLTTLGAKTFAYGIIGDDVEGDKLSRTLKDNRVNTDGIIRSEERPTIIKKRILCGNQQLLRIDWEDSSNIDVILEDTIIANLKKNIENLDAIILSDYNKGVLTERVAKESIKLARQYGKIITVDPKPSNISNYRKASSMTPNKKEAYECVNMTRDTDINIVGKKIRDSLELDNLLLTRSEEGVSIFDENGVSNIPTFAKEVYDVTGAGDTVISVYTLAKAAGATWTEAAKLANTAAGVVVGKIGTSTATIDEIIDFYNEIYKEWK